MESPRILLKNKVESLLIAEGIDFQNKDKCLQSLSECVAKSRCIDVYLEHVYDS